MYGGWTTEQVDWFQIAPCPESLIQKETTELNTRNDVNLKLPL